MIRANLIPPDTRGTVVFGYRLEVSDIWRALAAVGTSLLFALALLALFDGVIHGLHEQLNTENDRLAQLASQTNDVGELSANTKRLQEIDQEAAWLQRSGQLIAIRLAALGNAVPRDVWLEHMGQDQTGWTIDGDGRTLDAMSRLLDDVSALSPGLQAGFLSIAGDNGPVTSTYTFKARITPVSQGPSGAAQ
jgi:Tfp pilus assembly protein PilN